MLTPGFEIDRSKCHCQYRQCIKQEFLNLRSLRDNKRRQSSRRQIYGPVSCSSLSLFFEHHEQETGSNCSHECEWDLLGQMQSEKKTKNAMLGTVTMKGQMEEEEPFKGLKHPGQMGYPPGKWVIDAKRKVFQKTGSSQMLLRGKIT